MTSRGVTLVELMVVLVIVGIAAGMSGLAVGILQHEVDAFPLAVADARERAARMGNPVDLVVDSASVITLFPDGTVAPARAKTPAGAWRLDPWTGEVSRAGH